MASTYLVKCNISIHGKIIILNIVELSVRTVSACTMSAAQQRNPLYVRTPPPGSKILHQRPQQSTRLQQKRHRLNQSSLPNRQDFLALLVNPPCQCPPVVLQNHCQLQVFLRKPHFPPVSLQDHHQISCSNRPHLQTLQNPQYPVTVCSNHISESNSDLSAQLLLPQVKI